MEGWGGAGLEALCFASQMGNEWAALLGGADLRGKADTCVSLWELSKLLEYRRHKEHPCLQGAHVLKGRLKRNKVRR